MATKWEDKVTSEPSFSETTEEAVASSNHHSSSPRDIPKDSTVPEDLHTWPEKGTVQEETISLEEVSTHGLPSYSLSFTEWQNPPKDAPRGKDVKVFENSAFKSRAGKAGPTGRVEELRQWNTEFNSAYKQNKDGRVSSCAQILVSGGEEKS